MINQIQTSILTKPVTLLLCAAFLLMSFRMRGNGEVVLNAGTAIALETLSPIRSEAVSPGQIIDFRVRTDVKVGDQIVIRGGTIAKGQVMRAERAKGIGKEGFVEVQIKSVPAVDGQEILLTGGNVYQEGEDKQTLSIVLGVLVCILFLTMKGKNAEIPTGYAVNASTATLMKVAVN